VNFGEVIYVTTKPWTQSSYLHEGSDEHYFVARWMLDGCGAVVQYSDVVVIP
jgi:hypothetical protein